MLLSGCGAPTCTLPTKKLWTLAGEEGETRRGNHNGWTDISRQPGGDEPLPGPAPGHGRESVPDPRQRSVSELIGGAPRRHSLLIGGPRIALVVFSIPSLDSNHGVARAVVCSPREIIG